VNIFGNEVNIFGNKVNIFGNKVNIFGNKVNIFGNERSKFGKKKKLVACQIKSSRPLLMIASTISMGAHKRDGLGGEKLDRPCWMLSYEEPSFV
jgi:hypothetical protein